MLPCGVRTFLSRRSGSDHPPDGDFTSSADRAQAQKADASGALTLPRPAFNLRIVPVRALLPLLFLAIFPPARAQLNTDGPVKMTPDLALAIPLVQVNHDVMVKYPVLINSTTVLKPGMILRVIYQPSVRDDNSENLNAAHMGNMAESYSRETANSPDRQSMMPAQTAHELEHYRRVVWEVPINFQLALAQLPTDAIHLIYSSSGDERNLDDQRFNFFDGLFLGSPTGGISVLGVETDSRAEQAGFKAGDLILSLGGKPAPRDLAAFPSVYHDVRQEAEDAHASSFPVEIRSTGEAGSHTLNMPTPPMIKSLLMQGL
jgi:hypothetical protein